MQIGFDAKRIFHNTSGLGNYSRDVVRILATQFPANSYWLYNPKPGKINPFASIAAVTEQRPASFFDRIFSSYWRRRRMVKQLKKQGLDIFHGLSNELPADISKAGFPSVVTIHDLIFMRYPQWYKKADVHDVVAEVSGNVAVVWSRITLEAIVRGAEAKTEFTVTEVYHQEGQTWKLLVLTFSSVRDTHKLEHSQG
ncbi:MAG: hypothetical protein EOO03_12495 [Chitinophagaceae bacterium]|nr:MAG: hypothetical protein EOO03_12495 [Chitinophagaceae bacterium]